MAIDLDAETLIELKDCLSLFPGRAVKLKTVHRWRTRGVRKSKLECVAIGLVFYTTKEAIDRFIRAQNPRVEVMETPMRIQRRAEAARHQLARRGINLAEKKS